MLRVIAGSARRLQLMTVDGKETRPTTDRIKETLFNILQNRIGGSRFLDLFSGSGEHRGHKDGRQMPAADQGCAGRYYKP